MLFWETGAVGHAHRRVGTRRAHVPRAADRRACSAGTRSTFVSERVRPDARRRRRARPSVRGRLRRRRVRTQPWRRAHRRGRATAGSARWPARSRTTSAPRLRRARAREIEPIGRRRALRLRLPRRRRSRCAAPRPQRRRTSSRASAPRRRTACRSSATRSARDAVGLFASDKPGRRRDRPSGAAARRPPTSSSAPRTAYRDRWGEEMSPAALAGFSAAWALFAEVMPHATEPHRRRSPPPRSLPTCRWGAFRTAADFGSAQPGTATAGDNVAAARRDLGVARARGAHGGLAARARDPRDRADGHRP